MVFGQASCEVPAAFIERAKQNSLCRSTYAKLLLGECQDSVAGLFSGNGQISEGRQSSLRMLPTRPTRTVHYYWRKFDDAFIR
ncbi:hypothetical protein OROHE_013586 [Orobanche hederae]